MCDTCDRMQLDRCPSMHGLRSPEVDDHLAEQQEMHRLVSASRARPSAVDGLTDLVLRSKLRRRPRR